MDTPAVAPTLVGVDAEVRDLKARLAACPDLVPRLVLQTLLERALLRRAILLNEHFCETNSS